MKNFNKKEIDTGEPAKWTGYWFGLCLVIGVLLTLMVENYNEKFVDTGYVYIMILIAGGPYIISLCWPLIKEKLFSREGKTEEEETESEINFYGK
ncbi:hypothetical protein A3A95_04085 [Candidatus Nomurabacteria bacterium RIFCSPLOWO2_01_FULL_39_18]|uniref:Uncharacterized protein n=1 Tax=Candidatus Nomurabacteria bacterium RIFCSPHIGHO2_01_FULL_40_24b TaxID=1801739 RepID=A0A1F6V696_9BACT|nr:MAG: hypothetical protein A2647_04435 [Candidatus Nomurabacteria bacterium RIFCSPHIGHO2_01_FULL_40_24b]OGI89280.1 MAG: hypothetical protein A3A95_04085 [Candidatus Nomurabacteria bacterium RIFCSPLOWO2_01_FULL_39_18]